MKKLIIFFLIIILSLGSSTSCKKDNGDAPSLPPRESMIIDFSNFLSLKKSGNIISEDKGTENSNWDYSSNVAVFWHSIIAQELAIPVASFAHAIDQKPVSLNSDTWEWRYTVSLVGIKYTVRLTGQLSTGNYLWKMYVAGGTFGEFLWLDGKSKLDGTEGQWIFNKSSDMMTQYLQIDWTKTSSTIGTITYTYLKADSFNGSKIDYVLTSSESASYNVHYFNGIAFIDVDIEWNPSTHSGRIKSADYLLGDWYCWNEQKINILCN